MNRGIHFSSFRGSIIEKKMYSGNEFERIFDIGILGINEFDASQEIQLGYHRKLFQFRCLLLVLGG